MQTIGERLEEARKRKGISIREAAEATKIRGDYLQKFESNTFDIGLSDIYTRGFLRTYANFLKLPGERLVTEFRALGTPVEAKPKTVSREVYGRMDLSIASSGGKQGSGKEGGAAAPGLDEEEGGTKRTFARIGTSLPTGTFVDQRIIKKAALGVAIAVALILVAWGVKSVISTGDSTRASTSSSGSQNDPVFTLIALDTVEVKVTRKDNGQELFQGTLVRGEHRDIRKPSALYIYANEGRNLMVEINGKRFPLPVQGAGNNELK